MDEQAQSSQPTSGSNLNPLLIVVIVIIIAAVGAMLWLGNKKTASQTAQVASTTTVSQAPTQSAEQPTSPATTSAAGANTTEQAISVEGGNFYFKPNVITVKKGEKVKLTFTSAGGMHDFSLDEFNVHTAMISSGSTTVAFTPDKTGTFEFYCSVGNHRQMGMVGKLIVQ